MNDQEIKESIAKIYSDGFSHGSAAMLLAAVQTVEVVLRARPASTGAEVLKLLKDLKVPK